jgi:hypothetical protein
LPLDVPLPQSLPICLFSPASTYDRQLAAPSDSAAETAAAGGGAATAAETSTTSTIVGLTTTIEVRGAGLEQGKSHLVLIFKYILQYLNSMNK